MDLLSNTINSPTKPHSLVSKKRSSVFTPVNRIFRHSLSPSPRKCSHITSFCVCSMGRRKAFIKADHSSSKTSSPDVAARFLPPQSIMGWLCSRMLMGWLCSRVPHNLGFADEPYQASGVRPYREAVGCGGSASRPIPILLPALPSGSARGLIWGSRISQARKSESFATRLQRNIRRSCS